MYVSAIVDDDAKEAASLRGLIEEYFEKKKIPCMVHMYEKPMDFIRSACHHDIVFLDIRMDTIDGLEVARLFRKMDSQAMLIFVTHMAQLAIKGYEVDALDFIVKPADAFSISYVLDKALARLMTATGKVVALKTAEGIRTVSDNEITYVEVFDHQLLYHTLQGEISCRGKLSEVQEKLDSSRFVLPNRSFLVNLRHVQGIEGEELLVEGKRIPISKARRKDILERFSAFLGDTL